VSTFAVHVLSPRVPPAFTLRKENLETLEAISYLATSLGAVPADFSYAGVKDKRAVTHQAMVVRGVTVQRWVIRTRTHTHARTHAHNHIHTVYHTHTHTL